MVFNATFNNIYGRLYRGGQFLLMEEIKVPRENHQPVTSHQNPV